MEFQAALKFNVGSGDRLANLARAGAGQTARATYLHDQATADGSLVSTLGPATTLLPRYRVPSCSEPASHVELLLELHQTITHRLSSWLDEALRQVVDADVESDEEGFRRSSETAKGNARRVLAIIAAHGLPSPTVYPTAAGEIAIFFRHQARESGVLILCDSEGGGACFSTVAGKSKRARYGDATDMPDAFVLSEIERVSNR